MNNLVINVPKLEQIKKTKNTEAKIIKTQLVQSILITREQMMS